MLVGCGVQRPMLDPGYLRPEAESRALRFIHLQLSILRINACLNC